MTRFAAPLAVLAFLLAGCGGDEGGLALLDTAAQKTDEAESYKQELTMESDLEGQSMTMDAEGVFSADQQTGEMTATMEQGGEKLAFDALIVDGTMYLSGDDFGLPGGKKWLKTPDAPTSTMSPSEFVKFLQESGDVQEVGQEEIRGEDTTHFRGPVDIKELAEESGPEIMQELRKSPEVDKLNFMVDVWVNPDGLPARLSLDITADGVKGAMNMTSELLEYDVPVDVEAPPSGEVAEPGDLGGQGA